MDQQVINEREWHDPANWRGGILGIYSSEADTRILVPKRRRVMGWTFNFAHPLARFLFFAACIGIAYGAYVGSRRS